MLVKYDIDDEELSGNAPTRTSAPPANDEKATKAAKKAEKAAKKAAKKAAAAKAATQELLDADDDDDIIEPGAYDEIAPQPIRRSVLATAALIMLASEKRT